MARATIAEGVGTATVARRRGPALWRLVPLAFYLLAFTLVRGDLARLPGGVGDLSLHLYFAAMGLYVGGMFFYFAFFAYRTEALRWVAIALVAPGAAIHLAAIIFRGFADGHYPLANMYEYSSMLALVAVTVFLLMTIRWPVAGMGAERDLGRYHVDRLCDLPPLAQSSRLAGAAHRPDRDGGLPLHHGDALRRQPLDRRTSQLRERRRLTRGLANPDLTGLT